MNNNYEYNDPDYKYTYPNSGVLRNLLGIDNKEALHFYESNYTAKQAEKIKQKSPKINNVQDILKIHKDLFGKIYTWAGQFREVEISKNEHFFPTSHFNKATQYLDNLISKYKNIDNNDRSSISEFLAKILDTLNYFHPFREGNGRTQRMILYLLAKEKNYTLDLNPPDSPKIYETYMDGTINGNKELLTELIQNCIKSDLQQTVGL